MNRKPQRFASSWFMKEDSFRRIKPSNVLDLSNIRAIIHMRCIGGQTQSTVQVLKWQQGNMDGWIVGVMDFWGIWNGTCVLFSALIILGRLQGVCRREKGRPLVHLNDLKRTVWLSKPCSGSRIPFHKPFELHVNCWGDRA